MSIDPLHAEMLLFEHCTQCESVGVAEILITRVLLTNQSLQLEAVNGIFFVQLVGLR